MNKEKLDLMSIIREAHVNMFKDICKDMVYFDKEAQEAEERVIKSMAIPYKSNFFDYYEDKENKDEEENICN